MYYSIAPPLDIARRNSIIHVKYGKREHFIRNRHNQILLSQRHVIRSTYVFFYVAIKLNDTFWARKKSAS